MFQSASADLDPLSRGIHSPVMSRIRSFPRSSTDPDGRGQDERDQRNGEAISTLRVATVGLWRRPIPLTLIFSHPGGETIQYLAIVAALFPGHHRGDRAMRTLPELVWDHACAAHAREGGADRRPLCAAVAKGGAR